MSDDSREFPSTYHRHYLDDPYFDFTTDEGYGFLFWCSVVALIAATLYFAAWPIVERRFFADNAEPKTRRCVLDTQGNKWCEQSQEDVSDNAGSGQSAIT